MAVSNPLPRIRKICLAFPNAHEVEAWGEPTFRVKNKIFVMYAAEGNHHGSGRPSIWVKAAPGNQQMMVAAAPHRYFSPPYVGKVGWIGMWLDKRVRWTDVADLIGDGYELVVRKTGEGRRKPR